MKGCSYLIVLVSGFFLFFWVFAFRYDETIRYRMTVEIDTPQGLRSGSSVIDLEPSWNFGRPIWSLRGEAVAVDLPGGQTVFALIGDRDDPDYAIHLPADVFQSLLSAPENARTNGTPDMRKWIAYLDAHKPSAVLDANQLPMFVRFGRVSNPMSVSQVDPTRFADAFGAGVRLLRVTIQITDDPVTDSLRGRLPWLTDSAQPLNGSRSPAISDTITEVLNHESFRRGL